MVNKAYIKYIIDGLGRYEETILGGYEEGTYFFLGNNSQIKVFVEKVYNDRPILRFEDSDLMIMTDKGTSSLEIKLKEEVNVFVPIKPSPKYKVQLIDIKKEEQLYYI